MLIRNQSIELNRKIIPQLQGGRGKQCIAKFEPRPDLYMRFGTEAGSNPYFFCPAIFKDEHFLPGHFWDQRLSGDRNGIVNL